MDIERIKKMTFKELRNELARSNNNPVREKIIRSMMTLRYNQHMERKRFIQMKQAEQYQRMIMMRQQQFQQQMPQNNNQSAENVSNNEPEENVMLDDDDFNFIKPKFGSLNELDEQSNDEDFRPVRDIKEQERDKQNDHLVSRLNNDLELKKYNEKNKQDKVDIIPPFSNDANGMYAPFESTKQGTKRDFSNPKFGK